MWSAGGTLLALAQEQCGEQLTFGQFGRLMFRSVDLFVNGYLPLLRGSRKGDSEALIQFGTYRPSQAWRSLGYEDGISNYAPARSYQSAESGEI